MAELSPGNSLPVASLVLLAAATGALRVPADLRSVLSVEEPLFLAVRTCAGRGVLAIPIRSDHCYYASTWAKNVSLAGGGGVRVGATLQPDGVSPYLLVREGHLCRLSLCYPFLQPARPHQLVKLATINTT